MWRIELHVRRRHTVLRWHARLLEPLIPTSIRMVAIWHHIMPRESTWCAVARHRMMWGIEIGGTRWRGRCGLVGKRVDRRSWSAILESTGRPIMC